METVEKKVNKKGLLSITFIIMAALIIVIAANAAVWKNRLDKSAAIDLLTGEIKQVSREIEKSPAPPANLEARLAGAKAGLTAAQTAFPPEFNRNDVIDYIINLARECRVEVLPIASQGWAVDKAGQSSPILKLNGTITGSFSQTNEFIYRLQNGKYETLTIPELSITRQSTPDDTGAFSVDNTMVTVKLNINIYARPASVDKGNN